MGLPSNVPLRNGNSPNGSILVGEGKETNRDSLISSERNGKSPNRIPQGNLREMWGYGPGFFCTGKVEMA